MATLDEARVYVNLIGTNTGQLSTVLYSYRFPTASTPKTLIGTNTGQLSTVLYSYRFPTASTPITGSASSSRKHRWF